MSFTGRSGKKVDFQFSAGGVVVDGNKVLVIKTKNLQEEVVQTFPKGHIEKREKSEDSAVREVEEETGYRCEIVSLLDNVQYCFRDKGQLVKKTVKWFLMKPIEKIGEPDSEIISVEWLDKNEAKNVLSYKSDRELLKKI